MKNPSLHARFLIAPFIGIVLTIILFLTANNVIEKYTDIFKDISETDLVLISEVGYSISQLTKNNSDMISILIAAATEQIDEEEIYERSKTLVDGLFILEGKLDASMGQGKELFIHGRDIFKEIIEAYAEYQLQALASVEMSTVEIKQALYELDLANKKLQKLNILFLTISKYYVQILSEKAQAVEGSLFDNTYLTELAVIFVIFMLWAAIYFSNDISKKLNAIFRALMMLSKGELEIVLDKTNDNYFNQLWSSVDTFKTTLEENKNKNNDLLLQKYAMDQHAIISTTDIKGNITYVNDKFCEISGYAKKELLGKNHHIINSAVQDKRYWRNMYSTILKGKVWHEEVCNKAKDRHLYWVDTTIVPATNTVNKVIGYISIGTDISESKSQKEFLTTAKREAEVAAEAKMNFIATMSHEIRTPMNGVLGMAQLLADTGLNSEQQKYLNMIESSGNNLLFIINDILDFAKLDAGQTYVESINMDLELVCHECISSVAINNVDRNIEFVFDYEPNCRRYIKGDPTRIHQILLNLLGNAVKFTQEGFICLKVYMHEDNMLRIEVEDTGIGLKENTIASLFDQFTQADSSTTREYGGTGLGLAISKKLIHLMDGDIGVESIYGEGTTFWIEIEYIEGITPKLLEVEDLKEAKILYVDRSEHYQKIYKKNLEYMGAATTICSELRSAEALLTEAINSNTAYDIFIFNDDNNGESLNQIKKITAQAAFRKTKFVILTKIGKALKLESFSIVGVNAYIDKLCRYNILHAILFSLLNTSSQKIISPLSLAEEKKTEDKLLYVADILLVEDNMVNQMVAKKMLSNIGLTVDTAENGQQAIEAFQKKEYALIFMDCSMPIMNGYDATSAIRVIEKETNRTAIPIIALTANASREDQLLCKNSGMDDFLSKPIKVENLSDAVRRWLPVPK